jgi:hypothetical protein
MSDADQVSPVGFTGKLVAHSKLKAAPPNQLGLWLWAVG